MMTLLVVIFFSFIGIGLPDSVLGTAWPVMYPDLGFPISLAGLFSCTESVGTIIASLMSTRLIRRFGTGRVAAFSTLMTVISLAGFGLSRHPIYFFLLAMVQGLGAGAIDTALNSFVATHYSAAQMSFLHCFYGLGVAISPFVLSLALGAEGNWRRGYLIVASIQFIIVLVEFAALPLWRKVQKKDEEEERPPARILSLRQLVRTPGVLLSCFAFFSTCALEVCAGSWSASYFVNTRGLPGNRAASVTMLFYIGMAVGRLLSGLAAGKLGRKRLLYITLFVLPVAILLLLLPLPIPVTACGLFLIGIGIGPVYPNLAHLTPDNFGQDIAQSVMGIQQAMTYAGVLAMPTLFGVLAQAFSTALLPYYLFFLFAIYALMLTTLLRRVQRRKTAHF